VRIVTALRDMGVDNISRNGNCNVGRMRVKTSVIARHLLKD
jgi:hypothetical protein